MKKFLNLFIIAIVISMFSTSIIYAGNKREIGKVAVTDIEAPFSESKTLDTTGKVENGSSYRITNIAWQAPSVSSTGYYEVTVTLKADVGYVFLESVTGTVNGEAIIGKKIIDEDEIEIVYAFSEDSESSSTINNATSTVRYRISVYFDTDEGTITPKIARVLKGTSQTFKITPKDGYVIKDVVVDGESVGKVEEYTFKKVKENHIIKAYFEKDENAKEEISNEEIKPLLKQLLELFDLFI